MQSQSIDESDQDPLSGNNDRGPLDAPLRSVQSQRIENSRPIGRSRPIDEESSGSGLGIPQIAVGFITLALAAAFVVTSGALPGGGGGGNSQVTQKLLYRTMIRKQLKIW